MVQKRVQENNQRDGKQSDDVDKKTTKLTNGQEKKIKKAKKVTEKDRQIFASITDPYDVPLTWWEKDCVKYAINYTPVRSHLELLMGNHVVRLTDRKYILQLMSKTMEHHVEQQQSRIEKRKLVPPSIISRLLSISQRAFVERVSQSEENKT